MTELHNLPPRLAAALRFHNRMIERTRAEAGEMLRLEISVRALVLLAFDIGQAVAKRRALDAVCKALKTATQRIKGGVA